MLLIECDSLKQLYLMSIILQQCNKNTICNITKAVIVELNILKTYVFRAISRLNKIQKELYFSLQYKTTIFQHYK